jgi:polysaccharide biosynthesis/export protein
MIRPLSRLGMFFTALVTLVTLGGPATAQDAYRIRPGDVLRIEVLEDATLNRSVLVSPDGRISLPLAGSVQAAGNSIEAVQAALTAQLSPNFASAPSVFVSVERLAERIPAGPAAPPAPPPTIDIYVLGEVGNPGKLAVAPGTTVLQLFAQMGGFGRFAATTRIQLRRVDSAGVEQIYALDYDAIEAGTNPNGRTTLAEGDVIVVPQRRLFE